MNFCGCDDTTTGFALAAVAAVGAASAQVTLTGSVSAAFQSVTTASGTVAGLAMTDNTLNVGANEDLGGGMKVSAAWSIENDTARSSGFARGDQSVSLTTPIGAFAVLNTRSGGAQSSVLVAPVNLSADQWTTAADGAAGKGVIYRSAIDVLAFTMPVAEGLTASVKYLEAADGAVKPAATTYALGASYTTGGLKIAGDYVSTTYEPAKASNIQTTSTNLQVIYDAGVAKVGLGYDSSRRGFTSADKAATLMGISVPLGAITVGMNYGSRGDASFTHLGAQYDLSKRTNVNASWGQKKDGAADDTYSNYRLSLNHSF